MCNYCATKLSYKLDAKSVLGALMDHAIDIAKKENCRRVTLDSGYTRKDAHRFYLNKGFRMTSHHFNHDLN